MIKWPILLFISKEFVYFSEFIWIFSIFFYVTEFFLILKNERNITNCGYAFVTRFYSAPKNFPNDWTKICTVIAVIFFKNGIFIKVKRLEKNSYEFWKPKKLIWNEEWLGYLIIYWTIICFINFLNNVSTLLLCKINLLDIVDIGDFFQIFIISRSTEILIRSNFFLGMYVPYILNWIWKFGNFFNFWIESLETNLKLSIYYYYKLLWNIILFIIINE